MDRPITRDLDWGIPVPIDGWQGKCLYVWFEAVIGYLSAAIEWSQLTGQPDAWQNWWFNPDAKVIILSGRIISLSCGYMARTVNWFWGMVWKIICWIGS